MGTPKDPEKAILFTGLLYSEEKFFKIAIHHLEEQFGQYILESPLMKWSHSDFYREELGDSIKRIFFVFDYYLNPEDIADIKLTSNSIEADLSQNNKRHVNIDPGYVTRSKVVLATTKNYCHRIYLGKGIYAEVTLYFKEGNFLPTQFTYTDYKQKEYLDFFIRAREYLK